MARSLLILVVVAFAASALTAVLGGVKIVSVWGAGYVLGGVIGTLGFALVAGLIAAGVYWLGRRRLMPRLAGVIWAFWGVFAALNLIEVLRLH